MPRDLNIHPMLIGLSDIAERLGDAEKALAYTLQELLLRLADLPERTDGYNTEVAPVKLTRIIDLLHRLSRKKEADDLLGFAHHEAKRDIVRDVPEPLKFPLDLAVFERTFGPVDKSDLIASALGYLGEVYSWMGVTPRLCLFSSNSEGREPISTARDILLRRSPSPSSQTRKCHWAVARWR
jgi:hypothetical protein